MILKNVRRKACNQALLGCINEHVTTLTAVGVPRVEIQNNLVNY